MSKRPNVDLSALTADIATPMPEAVQRVTKGAPPTSQLPESLRQAGKVRTEDLVSLSFKVPPQFRRRFRNCANTAEIQLNELLVAALDAWEARHSIKS
jgi:hypothetical protein